MSTCKATSPQSGKSVLVFFFSSPLLGKQQKGKGWDVRPESSAADFGSPRSPLSLKLRFPTVPLHLFSFLATQIFPPSPPLLPITELYMYLTHGPATWRYFKWKCNFKPSWCRSGCSAFGGERFAVIQTNLHRCSCKSERALPIRDRFHGWPGIHSKTAWGPNIWSEPARQKFTSKLHQGQLWLPPQHQALRSDAPKEGFKTHFIIRWCKGWKDTPGNENMGWGGVERAGCQ